MQINSAPQMYNASAKKAKAPAPKEENGAAEKDWTVLMYIAGDNDLEPYAAQMMLDVEDKCGTTDDINVVAQLGRMDQKSLKKLYEGQGRKYEPTNIDGDWGGIRRYLVTKNDEKRTEETKNEIQSKCLSKGTGDKAMSDATTLADFLVYGMKKYPAKHYMVVLADHGGGFLGAFTSDANASGHAIMKPAAIASAFKIAETATGKKPEVVDMVACLMATSEVAHQMRDRAKYLLASEEIGTTASFDYGPIIQNIADASAAGKPVTAKSLARNIVHAYDNNPDAFKTKSAVDLPKMQAVTDSVKDLVDKLKASKADPEAIAAAIKASQNFGITEGAIYPFYDQIRDLKGLASEMVDSKGIDDKQLKKAAKAVMEAVDNAVVDNLAHKYQRQEVIGTGKTHDGKESFTEYRVYNGQYESHGLSIFTPLKERFLSGPKMDEYKDLDFAKETGWADFVTDLHSKLEAKKEGQKDGKVVSRPADPEKLPFNPTFKSYEAASSLSNPLVQVDHPPMSALEVVGSTLDI